MSNSPQIYLISTIFEDILISDQIIAKYTNDFKIFFDKEYLTLFIGYNYPSSSYRLRYSRIIPINTTQYNEDIYYIGMSIIILARSISFDIYTQSNQQNTNLLILIFTELFSRLQKIYFKIDEFINIYTNFNTIIQNKLNINSVNPNIPNHTPNIQEVEDIMCSVNFFKPNYIYNDAVNERTCYSNFFNEKNVCQINAIMFMLLYFLGTNITFSYESIDFIAYYYGLSSILIYASNWNTQANEIDNLYTIKLSDESELNIINYFKFSELTMSHSNLTGNILKLKNYFNRYLKLILTTLLYRRYNNYTYEIHNLNNEKRSYVRFSINEFLLLHIITNQKYISYYVNTVTSFIEHMDILRNPNTRNTSILFKTEDYKINYNNTNTNEYSTLLKDGKKYWLERINNKIQFNNLISLYCISYSDEKHVYCCYSKKKTTASGNYYNSDLKCYESNLITVNIIIVIFTGLIFIGLILTILLKTCKYAYDNYNDLVEYHYMIN